MARILVLGGGFGGLAAATTLREFAPDDDIVLVARDDRFAMGFAKLWDLSGQRPLASGTRSLHQIDGVTFVQAEITAVDPGSRSVETSTGGLEGDGMIVALGARPSPDHRQLLTGPGSHDLYDAAALPAIRSDLDELRRGRVVVSILGGPFKCPPAPYEAALIVDGLLRDRGVRDDVEVVLTTPQPMTLPAAGVDASRYVAGHLDDHGVELREQHRVVGVDEAAQVLHLAAGDAGADGAADQVDLAFDVLLGVPADAPPTVLTDSGLAGESGWIEPDRHRLTTTYPRVYAVGDCTVIPTSNGQLPHAGVFAAAQAEVAARNLVADLHGSDFARFDGHGYCFLELPGEQVAFVEGDFYADPPDVHLTPADHDQFLRKQAYERDRLAAWFST